MPDDRKATERLANERTFLAWVRTTISIMSLGFVVAKFGLWLRELGGHFGLRSAIQPSGLSGPIGIGLIAFGGVLTLLAAWRFERVNRQIERGLVTVDRGLILFIAIAIAATAVLLVAYLGASTATA